MTITTLTRSALALAAAAALAAPVAAQAKGGPGKADAHPTKGHEKAKHNPTVTYTFKGTVVSVDAAAGTAVAKIAKTNHHGRLARNATVTFDLTTAKLAVADVNADGAATLADVAAGDKVLVQARLPKRSPDLTGSIVARKLVDQTHPRVSTDDTAQAPAAG
jgi:desulfoferrodoxin (superoxide reductase-like protein)